MEIEEEQVLQKYFDLSKLPLELIYEIIEKIESDTDRRNFIKSLNVETFKYFNNLDKNGISRLDKIYINYKFKKVSSDEFKIHLDDFGTNKDFINAILDCNIQQINELINKDYNVLYSISEFGNTPIHLAILLSRKKPEILNIIFFNLKKYPKNKNNSMTNIEIINYENNYGSNPLFTAILYSSSISTIDTIQLLITNGANINYTNKYDITPLKLFLTFAAKESLSVNVLSLLIKNGANVYNIDKNNQKSLEYAKIMLNNIENNNFFPHLSGNKDADIILYKKIINILNKHLYQLT